MHLESPSGSCAESGCGKNDQARGLGGLAVIQAALPASLWGQLAEPRLAEGFDGEASAAGPGSATESHGKAPPDHKAQKGSASCHRDPKLRGLQSSQSCHMPRNPARQLRPPDLS